MSGDRPLPNVHYFGRRYNRMNELAWAIRCVLAARRRGW